MKKVMVRLAALMISGILMTGPLVLSDTYGAKNTDGAEWNNEAFLVYTGVYGEEQYPSFEYYRLSGGRYKYSRAYYPGELDYPLFYGDVLTAQGELGLIRVDDADYISAIDEDAVLVREGNCSELMEEQVMTIYGIQSIVCDAPKMAYYTYGLHDETGADCIYKVEYYKTDSAISLETAEAGDTVVFAMLEGTPVIPLTEAEHVPDMGDVNADGIFNTADIVSLQKWLLAVPDTKLVSWKAADFCVDERIDAFDIGEMKRELLREQQMPHCMLSVTTNYGGSGYYGQDLGSGSFTEVFAISEGDLFYETEDGHWLQNEKNEFAYEGLIAVVEQIQEDGVTFSYIEHDESVQVTVDYDSSSEILSTFTVFDGINYDYEITFSDYVG